MPIKGDELTVKTTIEYYIDKNQILQYTPDGSIDKPYKTINDALSRIILNADNSWTYQYRLKIASGIYEENIILENTAFYAIEFYGDGFRKTVIQPAAGNALQSTINNDNLAWLTFTNIWFAKAVNLTGENTDQYLGYNLFFRDCYFTGGTVLFKNISYPTFWGNTRLNGAYTLTFSNVTQATFNPYTEIGSSVTSFIIETDQTGGVKTPKEWGTGTRIIMSSCASSKDVTWSLINITTWTGTALQLRGCHFGSAGHTIPANATILNYFSTLAGNYTNNGTLNWYDGSITGTFNSGAGTLNINNILFAKYGKIGTAANNTEFEADGTLKFNGTATVFDDIPPIPLLVQRVGAANNPTLTAFIGNIYLLTFAVNDYVYFNYEFLHDYKEGSDIDFHIHWITNGLEGTDKAVKWEVEYSFGNSKSNVPFDAVFSVATILTVETVIPAGTTDKAHIISSFGTIVATSMKIGGYIVGRIRRIASDGTAPVANPFGLSLGVHIEKDTCGSRSMYIK